MKTRNLIQRIKNLWELSGYKPMGVGEKGETGDIITPLIKLKTDRPKKKKMAIIIPEDEPMDMFEEEKTKL